MYFHTYLKHFVFALSLIPMTAFAAEKGNLTESSSVMLFPDAASEPLAALPQAAPVNVLQTSGEWCLVESEALQQPVKGWVKCSKIARVSTFAEPTTPQNTRQEAQTTYNDSPRRFSLAINPVTLLFPWIELQIGMAFTSHFRLNLTPQLMTWGWGSNPYDGALYGGTISGTFFIDEWSGWYVEPGLVGLRPSSGSGYWTGGQVIGGYEHEWSSHAFVNLGIGVMIGHFDDGDDDDDWFDLSGTYPLPTGNLLVGYKF